MVIRKNLVSMYLFSFFKTCFPSTFDPFSASKKFAATIGVWLIITPPLPVIYGSCTYHIVPLRISNVTMFLGRFSPWIGYSKALKRCPISTQSSDFREARPSIHFWRQKLISAVVSRVKPVASVKLCKAPALETKVLYRTTGATLKLMITFNLQDQQVDWCSLAIAGTALDARSCLNSIEVWKRVFSLNRYVSVKWQLPYVKAYQGLKPWSCLHCRFSCREAGRHDHVIGIFFATCRVHFPAQTSASTLTQPCKYFHCFLQTRRHITDSAISYSSIYRTARHSKKAGLGFKAHQAPSRKIRKLSSKLRKQSYLRILFSKFCSRSTSRET